MKKYVFSAVCMCSLIFSLQAQKPLDEKMLKIMGQSKYAHATWSIYVKDTTTGAELFNLNADKMILPASTTKLFSVEALLKTYGDDYRFKTPVYLLGKLDNGVVNGNLVLVGQGDLIFGGRAINANEIEFTKMDHNIANEISGTILTKADPLGAINSLAQQIKDKGIKEINGDILIDDRLFETVVKRDMVLSPVMINENLIDFVINPGKQDEPARIEYRPKVEGYTVKNEIKTGAKGSDTAIEVKSDDQHTIVLKGTIAIDQKDVVKVFLIQDPNLFARNALIGALNSQGIKVNTPKIAPKLPEQKELEGLTPIATFVSAPLSEYGKLILKVSHNLGANLVPLLLGVKKGTTTFDEGMLALGSFVTDTLKISDDQFVFIDGAGGDDNRLTPKAEVALLEFVRNEPKEVFEKFYNSLPILGVDGSLADFGKGTDAVNKVRAKTGTGIKFNLATGKFFLTTKAFAGYIEGKNGHLLEFVIAVNNGQMPKLDDILPIFEDLSQMAAIVYDLSSDP